MTDAERINERLIGAATFASMQFIGQVVAYNSADNATYLDFVSQTYSSRVSYFGKPKTLTDVLADKAAYVKRWPWRSYTIDPDSWNVRCTLKGASCTVKGKLSWRVGQFMNQAQREGRAAFSYDVVSPLETPRITGEGGRVLK